MGARPQFIKAAVVSRALKQFEPDAEEMMIHTGQHFDADMSDVFFEELDIPEPHFNLGVGGGTHGQNTGRMVEKIEEVLMEEKPSIVLVYGDTNSTLAATLAAVKLHIPVAHVEAGLRSFNRKMPEEINRILTDHAADILFTPTDNATKNALSEGIDGKKIKQVGDVMCDAAVYYGAKAEKADTIIQRLSLTKKQYILTTFHREENVDDKNKIQQILKGLAQTDMQVIMPVHPRTKKRLQEFGIALPANITIIGPVGYLEMIILEKHAAVISTDSGGIQKEAYFHRIPCVTMREETEWVELVECGANILVGADAAGIEAAVKKALLTGEEAFSRQLYGNGDAGKLIAKTITEYERTKK